MSFFALALPTMETFSLLKYWRGGGAANVRQTNSPDANMRATTTATTVATSVLCPPAESEDDDDDNVDEGSFFDLEFAVNQSIAEIEGSTSESGDDEAEDHSDEVLSDHPSVSLSPSDDHFFKGQLLPLEPSSILITTATSSDSDPKSSQFPVSLLKSATRFRVFMLGLKKPKSDPNAAASSPKQNQNQNQSNKFFIKFKVEEVPFVSLFARESSGGSKKTVKAPRSDEESSIEEKKFSKETVQKYINKIKPLYVRVSKRYGDKLRFSGQLTADGEVTAGDEKRGTEASAAPAAAATAKVKLPAGMRVVRKRLGKSKSASAVVAAVALPPAAVQQRRDDSLLQQEDGIQSAIAHCKRSLNAAAAAAAKGSHSPLVRSKSDPTSKKGNGDRSG